MKTVTDGNNRTTTLDYNSLGQLTSVTPPTASNPSSSRPQLGTTTFTYDTQGRVATRTDGKGQTQTYSYDPLDRVTQINYGAGSVVSYAYDEDGNRTSWTDGSQSATFDYDQLNRLEEDDQPGSTASFYGYDAASNLTSVTDVGGTTNYGYDAANRLTSIVEPGGTCTPPRNKCTEFTLNDRDARTATTRLSDDVTVAYGRDLGDQISWITATESSTGTKLVDLTYSYADASSRKTRLRQTMVDKIAHQRTTYSYGAVDQLTRAQTRANDDGSGAILTDYQYSYDAAGNRTAARGEG